MKLLYGEFQYAQHAESEKLYMVFNYSGMREDLYQLGLLPIIEGTPVFDREGFEDQYFGWIFADDGRFCRFMYMMENLSKDITIYIVTCDDPYTDILVESFFKIIQLRYGIVAYHIGSLEDLQYIKETDFNSYYGIRNFNSDITRYNDIKEISRIRNGGTPHYE